MNKKILLTILTSLIFASVAKADFSFSEPADYTGEAFFSPATSQPKTVTQKEVSHTETMPPVKLLRLKIKEKMKARDAKKMS